MSAAASSQDRGAAQPDTDYRLRPADIDILTKLEREHIGVSLPGTSTRDRLRKLGLIAGLTGYSPNYSRREKRWYLTPSGRQALQDWAPALRSKDGTGGAA
ncbi:hypothetical protein E0H22_17770 [Rhodopseudomonas boonkerdii]|uniref:hypothetical protein n=1 Tax=Rhodopseudomonas boonkerdii TaxID=475937 RepID=UPI001E3F1053|nr:hypothetical protein [Rhodopseudomonas boonkerdii]UGV27368.1 hypothetical protein E0H22_17770 [Rhodopseudomonas boonkerdii]